MQVPATHGLLHCRVARDAEGIAMANLAPYVNHAYSVLRLSRGLPIPVKCCWNGLAIFDAEPVQYGGIRFRCVWWRLLPEAAAGSRMQVHC